MFELGIFDKTLPIKDISNQTHWYMYLEEKRFVELEDNYTIWTKKQYYDYINGYKIKIDV